MPTEKKQEEIQRMPIIKPQAAEGLEIAKKHYEAENPFMAVRQESPTTALRVIAKEIPGEKQPQASMDKLIAQALKNTMDPKLTASFLKEMSA